MDQRKEIGVNVRRLRKALRWSQQSLAKNAGVSRDTIATLESKKVGSVVGIQLATLSRLATALNVSIDDLLYAEAAPAPRPKKAQRKAVRG